jgi:hypothetical protein
MASEPFLLISFEPFLLHQKNSDQHQKTRCSSSMMSIQKHQTFRSIKQGAAAA